MFKVGECVIYKTDVCKIKEIKKNYIGNQDYYVLVPIDDESLVISVPAENKLGVIRKIISKEKVEEIIKMIPNVELITFDNEKMFEQEYKKLLYSRNYEDLIKIIKTTYSRNSDRLLNKKKISEKDDFYFKKAERMLYSEFAVSLNVTYDEAKKYVVDSVGSE